MAVPESAAAQARREAAVQAIGDVASGDWLVGVGARAGLDGRYPLSGFRGDLFVPVRLTLGYAPADRVWLEIRGDAWRVLAVRDSSGAAIPLDPGALDGRTADAGDFAVSLLFAPIGAKRGFAAGGAVHVTLPNSDERKGIGTNTTDVGLSLLGTWGASAWRATGRVGVGILEAPLEAFEQNDVVLYAFDLRWRAGDIQVWLNAAGRANTRDRIPLGTEDRGSMGLGVAVGRGAWTLDLGVRRGYAGNSATWTVDLGLSRSVSRACAPLRCRPS